MKIVLGFLVGTIFSSCLHAAPAASDPLWISNAQDLVRGYRPEVRQQVRYGHEGVRAEVLAFAAGFAEVLPGWIQHEGNIFHNDRLIGFLERLTRLTATFWEAGPQQRSEGRRPLENPSRLSPRELPTRFLNNPEFVSSFENFLIYADQLASSQGVRVNGNSYGSYRHPGFRRPDEYPLTNLGGIDRESLLLSHAVFVTYYGLIDTSFDYAVDGGKLSSHAIGRPFKRRANLVGRHEIILNQFMQFVEKVKGKIGTRSWGEAPTSSEQTNSDLVKQVTDYISSISAIVEEADTNSFHKLAISGAVVSVTPIIERALRRSVESGNGDLLFHQVVAISHSPERPSERDHQRRSARLAQTMEFLATQLGPEARKTSSSREQLATIPTRVIADFAKKVLRSIQDAAIHSRAGHFDSILSDSRALGHFQTLVRTLIESGRLTLKELAFDSQTLQQVYENDAADEIRSVYELFVGVPNLIAMYEKSTPSEILEHLTKMFGASDEELVPNPRNSKWIKRYELHAEALNSFFSRSASVEVRLALANGASPQAQRMIDRLGAGGLLNPTSVQHLQTQGSGLCSRLLNWLSPDSLSDRGFWNGGTSFHNSYGR